MPHSEAGPTSEHAGDQGSDASPESDSEEASEEKHLRRKLGRSEGRFELLVQEVKEYAIFMLDTEGYVQSWNQGAERIKGYTEEEIIGKHFSNFYTEEDQEAGRPETGLKSAKEEGQWTDEGWRVRKDGSRFWARVTITALYDEANANEKGELRGFAKVTRDMTERHHYEEELAEEKQRAERQKERAERKNALLRLMQRVASAANDAESFEEALQEAVDATSEQTGWPVGHVYIRDEYFREETLREDDIREDDTRTGEGSEEEETESGEEAGSDEEVLRSSGIWNRGSKGQFEACQEATEQRAFTPGEGLPGQVLETGEPKWIEDVTEEEGFLRSEVASEVGVKGAFAFPVLLEGKVIAVLEFYSTEAEAPDKELLEAMQSVGVQLSRVAEREWVRREREEARKRLEASEKRYRRLFEDAQEGIAITTPEGKILDANPAALKIFGITPEDLSALETPDLYVDLDDRKEIMEALRREGSITGREVRFQRPDGKEIICELSAVVQRGIDERAAMTLTFFRDVTARKKAEEALKESEARYRRLFEESRDAIVLTTPEGDIVDANEAAEELFGYSRGELLDLDAAELYADPEERGRRIVPEIQEASSSRLLEAEMRHKEGHTFLASASVTVHRGEEGEPELIQGLVRDITERRRLQEEVLRVQEEERKRLGQELHDGLASQLTGATLKLSLLSKRIEEKISGDGKAAEDVEEVREIIEKSGQDVRRLSRGLNPGGLSEGDLPSALEGLADNTEGARFEERLEAQETNRKEVDLKQSGSDSNGEANGDWATHLYRIAQEAVANARRHGEAEKIMVRLRHENEALVLEVEDDGKGFDPDTVAQEGLGIRSMRHRAELLGAELKVDSTPEKGTLVRCRLPV